MSTRRVAMNNNLNINNEDLAVFCKKNHINKLSFFGSVLGKDFGPASDIDVLVEFEPGHVPGLKLISMQEKLSDLLGGRKVDLVTPKFLNRHIRDKIMARAEVQYAG